MEELCLLSGLHYQMTPTLGMFGVPFRNGVEDTPLPSDNVITISNIHTQKNTTETVTKEVILTVESEQ